MQDNTTNAPLRILEIAGSGRSNGSVSRMLCADLIGALEARHDRVETTRRDLARGLPFVDEDWIDANFTAAEERSAEQRAVLAKSDELVAELQAADTIVIGMPIYNFGLPAALKAWIDMISRARLTFRYTDNGPEGLLKEKRAYVIVASGGVPVDSPLDFATPYLRQALRFVGITEVEVIGAEQLNSKAEESIDMARTHIAELIHTAPTIAGRAA